ncbi:uncharacterized protein YigA (DUF484 family) [Nitrobacteraceae bacterium AZCC 1564]
MPVEIQWKIFHSSVAWWEIFHHGERMENDLKQHLMSCATAFAERRNMKLTTLGRKAANDSPFFTRLMESRTSFTARKYDEIIQWFSDHWPADLDWPAAVVRPKKPSKRKTVARASSRKETLQKGTWRKEVSP